MKRTLVVVLLYPLLLTPSLAEPLYAGIQVDVNSIGILFGSQIDRTFSVEGRYLRSSSNVDHAGVTVDTKATNVGVACLARLPMKLNDGQPYFLFARAGAEYVSKDEKYYIPTSVTLTQPYSGKSTNHNFKPLVGGGIELSFTRTVSGRAALDFVGKDRSINLAAIMNF